MSDVHNYIIVPRRTRKASAKPSAPIRLETLLEAAVLWCAEQATVLLPSPTRIYKYHEHFGLTETSLSNLAGGKQEFFVDAHYDTPNFDLLKKNAWLVLRNNKWILKVDVSTKAEGGISYEEIRNLGDIVAMLATLTGKQGKSPLDICPTAYASFGTHRYKYANKPYWIDVAYFSTQAAYVVGTFEVELSASTTPRRETFDIDKEILEAFDPVPSKIIAFLKGFNRPLLGYLPEGTTLPVDQLIIPLSMLCKVNPFGHSQPKTTMRDITLDAEHGSNSSNSDDE
jgi:hypothetical protein